MRENEKQRWLPDALLGVTMGIVSVVIYLSTGIDKLPLLSALLIMAGVGALIGLIVFAVRRTLSHSK